MGRITSVTSGKGGVGKSTIALHLGVALAQKGNKVLVVELDNGLQSLDILAGCYQDTVFHLGDVIKKNCKPDEAIYECGFQKNLFILPGSSTPTDITNNELSTLCLEISEYFNIILLDTPAGIGNGFEVATHISDDSIVVLTPDPVSVRDAALVSDLLLKAGVSKQRLLINKVNTREKQKYYYKDFDQIIDIVKVQLLGVIPEEFAVMEASAKGEDIPIQASAKQILIKIADRYLGNYQPLTIS